MNTKNVAKKFKPNEKETKRSISEIVKDVKNLYKEINDFIIEYSEHHYINVNYSRKEERQTKICIECCNFINCDSCEICKKIRFTKEDVLLKTSKDILFNIGKLGNKRYVVYEKVEEEKINIPSFTLIKLPSCFCDNSDLIENSLKNYLKKISKIYNDIVLKLKSYSK